MIDGDAPPGKLADRRYQSNREAGLQARAQTRASPN